MNVGFRVATGYESNVAECSRVSHVHDPAPLKRGEQEFGDATIECWSRGVLRALIDGIVGIAIILTAVATTVVDSISSWLRSGVA